MRTIATHTQVAAAATALILTSVAVFSERSLAQRMRHARLEAQLESRISVTWRGQTLVNATRRLSELYGVAVWLDRRVDPHAPVNLVVSNHTLREVVQQLAEQQALGAAVYRDLVFVGPKHSSGELATLAAIAREAVDHMAPPIRRRWMQPSRLQWKRLSEPRLLVQDLVASADGNLTNPESIPHDLWPAGELGRMTIVDSLELILSGFDLTCQFSSNGSAVRIVPIERPVQLVQQYQLSPQRLDALHPLLQKWPGARLESAAGRHRLAASWEQHQEMKEWLGDASAGSATTRSRPSEVDAPSNHSSSRQRYTLQLVDKPLGAVLDQLADQLGLAIEWSDQLEVESLRGKLVSCDVRQADQRELLGAVLGAAGLSFRTTASGLLVIPAD